MDDTQQTTQPTMDPQVADTTVSSMSDVAGMTPPPAPVMPAEPAMPTIAEPAQAAPAMNEPSAPVESEDDFASAEDVLNEILDSLDRIEAKLEAMEKKMG